MLKTITLFLFFIGLMCTAASGKERGPESVSADLHLIIVPVNVYNRVSLDSKSSELTPALVHDCLVKLIIGKFKVANAVKEDRNGCLRCEIQDVKGQILKDKRFFEKLQFRFFIRENKENSKCIDLDLNLSAYYSSGTDKPSEYKEMDLQYFQEMTKYGEDLLQEIKVKLKENQTEASKRADKNP